VPKIALPKYWLAKILVELLPTNWPTLAKKNKVELVQKHWQTKKLVTIQRRTNLLAMTKKLVRYVLVAIQTHPKPCGSKLMWKP
jgi:hypothetical protein